MDAHVHKINRDLIIGWWVIVLILFVSYSGEVIKGERTLVYLIVFMLFTMLPPLACTFLYRKNPEGIGLRYCIVAGYFLMYVFSMITGSTSMVFSYILPLLAFLVLYHQPRLILATGFASLIVNLISIGHKIYAGEMTVANSKDAEIQIALLFLCFGGSYVATRLYDEITCENIAYTRELDEKNTQIQKITLQTIATIANTIDAKDEYTRGHSKRVSEYSVAIAKELGIPAKDVRNIRAIALLHDIGKIGVPDAVLNKPGRLTQEEYQLMKQHTIIGAEILKDIEMLPGIDIGAKYHHERYDGQGYPDGLKGSEIPEIARIIAVADAYDAMTSNRIYRRRLSSEKVLAELESGIGTQFDPKAADALITLLKEGRLQGEDAEPEEEMGGTFRILSRIIERQDELSAEKLIMDELTGVYNRSYGKRLLQEMMEQGKGCVIRFDIDKFRLLNDDSGYIVGDVYLKMAAECIRHISPQMVVSRFGGDDFVAYAPDIRIRGDLERALMLFMEEIGRRAAENGGEKELSVSVGAVLLESGGESFNDILVKVDKALFVAKSNGGNRYFIYQQEEQREDSRLSHTELGRLIRVIRNRGQYEGAFQASYPEFQRIYDFVEKIARRNDQKIQVLLYTLLPNDEERVSIEERQHAMELLEKAIAVSVRSVDVMTKYSSSQRLVLLMNMDEEQIHIVTDRIMKEFFRMYDKKDVSIYYDVADLSVEPQE